MIEWADFNGLDRWDFIISVSEPRFYRNQGAFWTEYELPACNRALLLPRRVSLRIPHLDSALIIVQPHFQADQSDAATGVHHVVVQRYCKISQVVCSLPPSVRVHVDVDIEIASRAPPQHNTRN